jgi:hypothetical protein
MNAARVYLLLAIAGLVLPWYFNLAYLGGGGSLAPGPFLAAVSVNALTSAITWDVYIAAAVASIWMVRDGRRHGIRRPWLYVVLCFAVGLSFAYPLYLARREASAH